MHAGKHGLVHRVPRPSMPPARRDVRREHAVRTYDLLHRRPAPADTGRGSSCARPGSGPRTSGAPGGGGGGRRGGRQAPGQRGAGSLEQRGTAGSGTALPPDRAPCGGAEPGTGRSSFDPRTRQGSEPLRLYGGGRGHPCPTPPPHRRYCRPPTRGCGCRRRVLGTWRPGGARYGAGPDLLLPAATYAA